MENIIDIQAVKFGIWLLKNTEQWYDNNGDMCWRYLNYPTDYTTEEMYDKFLDEGVDKL